MPAPLRLDVEAKGDADDLVVMAAEARAFKQELDALDGRKAKATIKLNIPNGAELVSLKAGLDGIDGRTAKAKLQLTGPAAADLTRLTSLKAALDDFDGRVARATVSITGAPSAAEVRQMRAAAKALRELDGAAATTSVQFTGNLPDPKELRAVARALKQLQDVSPVNVVITVSSVGGDIAMMLALARALRALPNNTTANVNTNVDKSVLGTLSKFTTALAGIGAAGSVAGVGLVNATAAVATLAGSLVSVAGVAPVAVAGLVAGGAAAATLKVGLMGVSDALKESDPAKFAEALKKLSPEAATFARTVREIGPAWKSVQLDTQQKLFAGLGGEMQKLSGAYLPSVKSGLGQIATGFNGMAKDLVGFATSADTVRDVDTIFRNTGQAVQAARPGVVNLAEAFRDVAAVGSAELPQLAAGWTNATARFRDFISNARDTGQLKVWIDEGVQTLQQLGTVAGNVGSSLASVFRAAKESGADFLTTLVDVTERVDILLASKSGQLAMVAMFREARAAANELLPGVEALARGVLDMIQSFANTGAVQNFARVVTDIAQTLEPLGATIGSIAGDALNGLANGASVALGPLSALVGGVSSVAGALGPLPGLVLAAVVAFKGLSMAGPLFVTMSAAATRAAQSLAFMSYNAGAMGAAAGAGSRAASGLSTVLSKMGTALPLIGVALIGIGAAADAASVDFEGLTQKVANGALTMGQAVQQAQTQATTGFAGFINGIVQWQTGIDTAAASADKMRQSVDEYRASLSPMQQAQFDVTRATAELNDAVIQFGSTSPQATAAAANLAAAQGRLDAAHRGAAEAAKTQAQREKELTDALQGQIGGMVAYEQAVIRTAEAHKKAADALKQNGANSVEYKSAVLDLVSAIDSQAQAAQKQAEAWGGADAGMKAYRLELLRAADTSTQAGRDAFIKLASSLDKAGTDALSATAKMSGLRTEIVTLPDGRQVTVVVAADRGKLPDVRQEVQDFASQKFVGTVEINATSRGLHDEVIQAVTFANGQKGTIQLFADGSPAMVTVGETKYRVDATTGTLQILGNPAPGEANLSGFKLQVDSTTGQVQILANPAPGQTTLMSFKSAVDGSSGTVTLNANGAPAEVVLNGTKYKVDATTGVMTIDGNPAPGQANLSGLKVSVDRTTGTITILGKDGGVAALKAQLSTNTSSTHTIYVKRVDTTGPISGTISPKNASGAAIGGIVTPMARGGVIDATGYAAGGVRLRPMRGGIAQRVPANSWRVIGDRVRGDEFYLPDDDKSRTMQIGAEWARRRGLQLVSMAQAAGTAAGQAASSIGARVAAAAGPRGSGSTTIVQPPNLAPLLARIGSLENTIQTAMAVSRPITVEDRSGDPAETARRTQLALRL